MSQLIIDALLKLDPENKDQWTGDGLPKVDALGVSGLTRAEITKVAPHFTKDNPKVELPEEIKEEDTEDADETEEETNEEGSQEADTETPEEESAEKVVEAPEVIPEGLPPVISDVVVEEISKEDKDDLLKEKQAATEKVEKTAKLLNDAQRKHDAAIAEFDDVENKLEASQKGHTTQHDIMHFIKSQAKLREQKAARHHAILNSGLDLNALGAAPIDKAMARRNNRGTNRPQR